MDPTPSPDRAASPAARSLLVVAGLVLMALSFWAFTEHTRPERSAAAGLADPGDVYDPVVAGERLPDGFRQLLPRDGIPPVYEPTFRPADATPWPDATHVIGVAVGDESKAYPVSFLNGRELVVDEVGGLPLLVSW